MCIYRRPQVVAICFLTIAAGMVPWTVLLGLSVPPRHGAGHWNLLWISVDVGLIFVLSYAAWVAWFHRPINPSTFIVAGMLLLLEAWFNGTTSLGHRDRWIPLLIALAGEVPLTVVFFWFGQSETLVHRSIVGDWADNAAASAGEGAGGRSANCGWTPRLEPSHLAPQRCRASALNSEVKRGQPWRPGVGPSAWRFPAVSWERVPRGDRRRRD